MATGLVRAALCSFVTEESVVEVSERNKKAQERVQYILSKVNDEDFLVKFDEFAQSILQTIEKSVRTSISSATSIRAKCVLREKLWSNFHQLRVVELESIWKDFFKKAEEERFDPIVEQHVNQSLFKDLVKSHAPAPPSIGVSVSPPTLSPDEENVIRYAAGYVPMKLMKRYEKQSSKVAVEYVECLSSMAVNGDESSLEAYTLEWSRKLNRGGLFEVNDETYRFFREVEVKMQSILMAVLKRSVAASGQKQVIIDTVASDDDVQFFWALLTCDIQREEDAITLLKDIVELWLTIRGFSVAGAWLEQHKQKSRTNSRKSKGLRKKLSERAPETN